MRKNSGFTLIEVMVAVGVLAIALPALLFNMMEQINSTTHLRDKLQAEWVAENVLTEMQVKSRLSGAVPEGEGSGTEELGGRKWYWKSRSKVFPQEEFSDLYGVEITVWPSEEEKKDDPIHSLYGTLRAFDPAPAKMPPP